MRLLIIGNLEGHMSSASKIAIDNGVKVTNVRTIDEGLKHARSSKNADLAFVDITLEIGRFIHALKQERIQLPVVACGLEDVRAERAQEVILQGAKEYLPLPPNAELIAKVLEAVAHQEYQPIHRDPAIKAVIALADQIAPTEASVLITGESGTGKEVFARYLHHKSKRASGPYVALNCAAIPDNLLESELFGHERGAFSGAIAQRIGKFEAANGGTILLDEISEMDLRLQAKLLRVIQEKEIDRVGGRETVAVNVRILASSNRDLQQSVYKGEFREDLYFRLNVVNLQLPALRERPMDILLLAEYFRDKYADNYAFARLPFSQAAKQKLQEHSWPGNVRELENIIHGAVVLSNNAQEIAADICRIMPAKPKMEVGRQDLPNVGQSLANVERRLILDTFRYCLGNSNDAAAILGISLQQLQNRLQEYGEI